MKPIIPSRRHALLSLTLTVLALAATWTHLPGALEAWGYRLSARFAPQAAPGSAITVVTVEADTPHAARTNAAAAIEHLHQLGAGPIGLMLPLDRPATPPGLAAAARQASGRLRETLHALNSDGRLTDALAGAGNVVLTAVPREGPGETGPGEVDGLALASHGRGVLDRAATFLLGPPGADPVALRLPLGPFRDPAAGLGALPDWHERTRVTGVPLIMGTDAGPVPGLALALMAAEQGLAPPDAVLTPRRHVRLGETIIALAPDGSFQPRPLAPAAAQRRVRAHSLRQLMDGDIPASVVRGAPVLVAAQEPRRLLGPAGGHWSPATWTAQSLAALRDGDGVHKPAWFHGAQRGAIAVLGLYLLVLPRRLRGRAGLALSAVLAIGLVNVGVFAVLTRALWLPAVAPAAFVLAAHVLAALHHRREATLAAARMDAAQAHRALGQNLQNQGQLDAAFEQYRRSGAQGAIEEPLYQLGLEYERRRQFPKALEVYELLDELRPGYRDLEARRQHLETVVAHLPAARGTGGANTGTVMLDNPAVEKPTFGRYRVQRLLGQGAMGAVYLGEDPKIARTVAIKVLPLTQEFEGRALDEARERLRREAEAAGRLSHPGIVAVHVVGEDHDLAYIAMDFAPGQSLEGWTEPERLLPINEVLVVCAQVADALDYAHRQKVVHRDIKPSNVIYDRDNGTVKVTDFGVASLADDSKTRTGMVLGSPSYMSPEQIAGRKLDGRSDLFSLGVTLYELLAGRLPFAGDSLANLSYHIIHDRHPNLGRVRRGLPSCASRIVNKALQKDPAKRYASGAAMADALRRCAGQKNKAGRA